MTFPHLELTDLDGRRLACGTVHSWTTDGFVFPGEGELGKCGTAEKGESEGRQQHVEEGIMIRSSQPSGYL